MARILRCFTDECGLETKGRILVVASAVIEGNAEEGLMLCEQIERESGKNKFKWGKAEHSARMQYLNRIFAARSLNGRLCYAVFQTKDYDTAIVESVARAIRHYAPTGDYTSLIYIDALSKTKRAEYKIRIRKQGINIRDARGIAKDENNALIRLADAVAGFVRDALDSDQGEIRALFDRTLSEGALIELTK
jgi:hypothetical protein